jgi:cellulose synthase/poly-beta-1,6-N-acetylglucosamine synthase-like glycosyltransferase
MLNLAAIICGLVLLVPWVLYPLGMHLAGLLLRRRTVTARRAPSRRVSIVIATRETPGAIADRVANCLAGTYPADLLQVVVSLDAGGATLEAVRAAIQEPRVLVLRGNGGPGKAESLNTGVAAADGEIVVLTDTHQRFNDDTVAELVASLGSDSRLGAVSGCLEIPATRQWNSPLGWYWRAERQLRENEARIHSSVGVSGSVYAIWHRLWQSLPSGLLLDDLYVPMLVVLGGHRIGFSRRAIATDLRCTEPQQEYQRKVRTLTGNLQLMAWLPQVLLPTHNPIWPQFVCHKLLRLLTPYALLGLLLWTVVQGALLLTPQGRTTALGLLLVIGVWLHLERGVFAKEVRLVLAWLVLLQAAPVAAAVNGLRGRWNVWR